MGKRLLLPWRLSTERREKLRPRLKLRLRLTLGCITLPTDTGLLDTLITPIMLLWHTVDIITESMDLATEDTSTEDTMDTDIITLYLTTILEDVETTWELRYLVHKHHWWDGNTFYFRPELSFCSQSYSQ